MCIRDRYPDSEDLWFEVLDYLDEHYDLEATEKIFISGDGASWIKKGLEIIPESVFVLDRFHLEKYLQEGLGKYPSTYLEVRKAMEDVYKRQVLNRAKELDISWPLPVDTTDAELEKRFFPNQSALQSSRKYPDYDYIDKEMMRNGVTLKLLWHEYCICLLYTSRGNGRDIELSWYGFLSGSNTSVQ